jgi:hypothetical protein
MNTPETTPRISKSDWKWFAIVIAVFVIGFALGSGTANTTSSAARGASLSSNSQSSSQQSHPAKPTTAPVIAPMSSTSVASGTAVLGANISVFLAKYGALQAKSNTKMGQYQFHLDPSPNIHYLSAVTYVGNQRVESISLNPNTSNGSYWSGDQADITCSSFFPADTVYQRQVTITSSTGYDKIYFSASLANVLPASEFQDVQQNPTKLGLFDVQYLTNTDGTINSCSITTGTSQTQ